MKKLKEKDPPDIKTIRSDIKMDTPIEELMEDVEAT
jgi:hypothetical protein